MFSSSLRSLALVGAVSLSGCGPTPEQVPPTSTSVDGRSPLERATVIPTPDGGVVLQMNKLPEIDRLLAVAEWRTKNPGEFIMRPSDARYPLGSYWVQMIPIKITTTNESTNTIMLSNESFGAVDSKNR